jgi:hypothetical protein
MTVATRLERFNNKYQVGITRPSVCIVNLISLFLWMFRSSLIGSFKDVLIMIIEIWL